MPSSTRERLSGTRSIIRLFANQIDEAQGVLNGPPTINPTHTQLAKDHDDHPLHVLAAQCAMVAVAHVGGMVHDHWTKTDQTRPSIASVQRDAKHFFVHPDLIARNPTKPLVEIQKLLQDFANNPSNAGAIARASSRTPDLDHLKRAKEFGEKSPKGFHSPRAPRAEQHRADGSVAVSRDPCEPAKAHGSA